MVIDQKNIFHVLIDNLKNAGPSEIVMPFSSFSDSLLEHVYDHFSKKKKHAKFWLGVPYPLRVMYTLAVFGTPDKATNTLQ